MVHQKDAARFRFRYLHLFVCTVALSVTSAIDIQAESGSSLFHATCVADADEVQELLSSGVEPDEEYNVQMEQGYRSVPITALAIAVANQDKDITRMLLEAGADPNRREYRATVLEIAIWTNDLAMVELLVEHGAEIDPHFLDRQSSPRDLAVANGHNEIADFLCERGAHETSSTLPVPGTFSSVTGLGPYQAVLTGDLVFARFLQKVGEDFNTKYTSYHLAYAISSHNADMVRFLLENGADPVLPASYGRVAEYLFRSNTRAGMNDGSYESLVRTAQILIDSGDENLKCEIAHQSVIAAAIPEAVRARIIRIALASMDLKKPCDSYSYLLFTAMADYLRQRDLAIALMGKRAPLVAMPEVNIPDELSPWTIAIRDNDLDLCKDLLTPGNKLDRYSKDWRIEQVLQPEHYAAYLDRTEILREIAASYGDLGRVLETERMNDSRWTPLHIAAAAGNIRSVSLLLEMDVSPCPVDDKGKTAADLARLNGFIDIADLLDAASRQVSLDRPDTLLPLEEAAEQGDVATLRWHFRKGEFAHTERGTLQYFLHESMQRAIRAGQTDAVKYLLTRCNRAEWNPRDEKWEKTLTVAGKSGNLELIKCVHASPVFLSYGRPRLFWIVDDLLSLPLAHTDGCTTKEMDQRRAALVKAVCEDPQKKGFIENVQLNPKQEVLPVRDLLAGKPGNLSRENLAFITELVGLYGKEPRLSGLDDIVSTITYPSKLEELKELLKQIEQIRAQWILPAFLCSAIPKDNTEGLILILDAGAPIDCDCGRQTPLDIAERARKDESRDILLQRGGSRWRELTH